MIKVRNKKGQFVTTTGSTRYKKVMYKSKNMNEHRKIWIQNNGDIPKNKIIHHINGNKKDNRIENLQCMSYKEHNLLHFKGSIPWNKGLPKEKQPCFGRKYKFGEEAKKKQKETWKKKYIKSMREIHAFSIGKVSHAEIGSKLNLTKDQVAHRLGKYRRSYLGGEKNG